MRTEQKVFNDLIETIVRNSENNISTITNVKLWAKSWQTEMEQELTLTDVSNCPFEAYAVFCIECDRQGMKPIKYKDYLNLK